MRISDWSSDVCSSDLTPEGRDLEFHELRDLLAAYNVELWEPIPVTTLDEAIEAGHKLGWNVILKATAEHLRNRPDLAHVWRAIDDEDEMRDGFESLLEVITDPASAGFVVQKSAPPGVPVGIGAVEDPLFGPVR